jgi:geranylgeranyl pyrophosphate synthase
MQEAESFPQIAHATHCKKDLYLDLLAHDNTLKKFSTDDRPQCISSRLQTFLMEHNTEIQELHTQYLMNIDKLRTEIETWKQTSEVMKEYMDEIKSSIQHLEVIFKVDY